MPTVAELTAVYANFMIGPRRGPHVCRTCFNFTRGFERCYACTHNEDWLDAAVPISYSVAHEQLHHCLAQYKRTNGLASKRLRLELAAVLWRFLAAHEACVARRAETKSFDVVTTVPSGIAERDETHPLRWIVGHAVGLTKPRYRRLLRRSTHSVSPRRFDRAKYEPVQALAGESVLLIDDTWTSGASAQSAAAALKSARAGIVAAVVLGRHLNRDWHANDHRLRGITRPFDWTRCALCADPAQA